MEYRNKLTQYLISQGVEEYISKQLVEQTVEKRVGRGEMLLRMGEHTDEICFILKGLVRGVYINEDGDEVTKCFTTENQWCCIYNMIREEPSEFFIEAIEDCTVAAFSVKRIQMVMNSNPDLRGLLEKLFIEAYLKTEKRNLEFQKMSAAERYHSFRTSNPKLEQRIPQQFIASYLGITPSSLSRIRRNENIINI